MYSIRKRGNVYEYTFDVSIIDRKRKRVSKSEFKTKKDCEITAIKAYNEFNDKGITKVSNENMSLC